MLDVSVARFKRLNKLYLDPMTEVYLMFYQSTLQVFISFNKFLQREYPIISVIIDQINSFLRNLFGRFLKVAAIKQAGADISSIDYTNNENQLSGTDNAH